MTWTEETAARNLQDRGVSLKFSKGGKVLVADLRSAEEPLPADIWDCLRCLTSLRELFLADMEVGDDEIAGLEELGKLTTLDLQNTQVTDAGLQRMKAMPNLRLLLLNGSRVTREGVAEMRKAMLRTRIVFMAS